VKLTWHIVRKDFRRLWPWLALLAAAILLRYTAAVYFGSVDATAPEIIDRWDLREIADWTLLAVTLFSTALIAATLVHTDPATGTKAFWITRPIAPPRLLLSKILTLLLVLVLLPLLFQLAWWNFHDYSAAQIAAQFPVMLARHSATAFAAFFFALLTRNVGHFFLSALLVTLLFGAMMTALKELAPRSWIVRQHNGTWSTLVMIVVVAGIIAAILTQYLTRRTRLTIGIIASIFVLSFAFSALWRWPLSKPASYFANFRPLSSDPQIVARCESLTAIARESYRPNRGPRYDALTARVIIDNIPPGTVLEFFEPRLNDSRLKARFVDSQFTLESAFDASPSHQTEAVTITKFDAAQPTLTSGATMTVPALLRNVQIVARLPLTTDAQTRVGAFSTRVIRVTHAGQTEPVGGSAVRHSPLTSLVLIVAEVAPSHLIAPNGYVEDHGYFQRSFSFASHEAYLLLRDNEVVSALPRNKGGLSGNSISTDGVQYDRLTLRFPDILITKADLPRYELVRAVTPAIGTFERTFALQTTNAP
jgi:MFS family permease